METLFLVVNYAVLPFWFLMICLPTWTGTRRLLRSPLVLLPLPVLYVVLLAPRVADLLPPSWSTRSCPPSPPRWAGQRLP
jgi:hypothetical protein